MKIDEAIQILKDMNDGYTFKNCEVCISDNKYDEKDCICKSKTCEYLQAIETVLKDRERLIKKNKEWKASLDYIYEAYQDIGKEFFNLKENSISKDKIRAKIEEYNKKLEYSEDCGDLVMNETYEDYVRALEKLLEEE